MQDEGVVRFALSLACGYAPWFRAAQKEGRCKPSAYDDAFLAPSREHGDDVDEPPDRTAERDYQEREKSP